jgi:hypothetical protein
MDNSSINILMVAESRWICAIASWSYFNIQAPTLLRKYLYIQGTKIAFMRSINYDALRKYRALS